MTRAGDFYQESIKDTFHMLEYYADVIAIRHFQQGAPAEAAKWASIPVINCGDGWGEHPTQVLTDLYTILHEKGTLDGLTYLLVGDMRMRTMHSILYALSQFDAKAIVVGPPDMSLLPEFKAEIDALNVDYEEAGDVRDVIGEADIIYMEPVVQADYTASRVERGSTVGLTPPQYVVTRELLRDPEVKERLLVKQREYLLSLASPALDDAFVAQRRRIGEIHQKIGLEPRWYLGAYALYLSLLTPVIYDAYPSNPERAMRSVVALQKLLMFDAQLAMEAYIVEHDRQLTFLTQELESESRQLAHDLEEQGSSSA
jgi:hypothetical protein